MSIGTDKHWLLQRRLAVGDCAKWRTVLRFSLSQSPQVERLLKMAALIDRSVAWRVAGHNAAADAKAQQEDNSP